MECPICYKNLTKNSIRLECKHNFCFECAFQWITKHTTCPLCRKEVEYFDRSTRSQSKSKDLFEDFICILAISLEWFDTIPHSENTELIAYSKILEKFVLQEKNLWYRPHMRVQLHRLDKMIFHFIERMDSFPKTKVNKKTREIFIRLKELCQPPH